MYSDNIVTNVRHTCIVVNNLDLCRNFYSGIGFKEVASMEERSEFIQRVVGIPQVILHWTKLRIGEHAILELIEFIYPDNNIATSTTADNKPPNRLGFSHIALETSDIYKLCRNIEELGGSLVSEPIINPAQTHLVCYSRDIEGNILELVETIKT